MYRQRGGGGRKRAAEPAWGKLNYGKSYLDAQSPCASSRARFTRRLRVAFCVSHQATLGRFLCISPGDLRSPFFLHFPRFFNNIWHIWHLKNTKFVTRLSRQAHDREICLNPAVAILRHTSHCVETARFLPPPFFLVVHTTPLIDLLRTMGT